MTGCKTLGCARRFAPPGLWEQDLPELNTRMLNFFSMLALSCKISISPFTISDYDALWVISRRSPEDKLKEANVHAMRWTLLLQEECLLLEFCKLFDLSSFMIFVIYVQWYNVGMNENQTVNKTQVKNILLKRRSSPHCKCTLVSLSLSSGHRRYITHSASAS